MKIKKINFTNWIFYPVIFNPFALLIFILLLIIFPFSYWKIKKHRDCWEIVRNPYFYQSKRDIIETFLLLLINSVHFNRDKVQYNARYYAHKWIEGKGDYQDRMELEMRKGQKEKFGV